MKMTVFSKVKSCLFKFVDNYLSVVTLKIILILLLYFPYEFKRTILKIIT